jgi:hypothetical protein
MILKYLQGTYQSPRVGYMYVQLNIIFGEYYQNILYDLLTELSL